MIAVAEAQDGDEVLGLVAAQQWDIVVLDISMPGRNWLDVLSELKHARLSLPVLMLSMHPEDRYGVRALHAGAAGYLTKDSAPGELVIAIRRVLAGHKYIGPLLAEQLALRLADNIGAPLHERLSDREYLVLCLIASGKTVSQIAEQLSLSVKTISTYRARVLAKMKLHTTAELVHYVVSHHLME